MDELSRWRWRFARPTTPIGADSQTEHNSATAMRLDVKRSYAFRKVDRLGSMKPERQKGCRLRQQMSIITYNRRGHDNLSNAQMSIAIGSAESVASISNGKQHESRQMIPNPIDSSPWTIRTF